MIDLGSLPKCILTRARHHSGAQVVMGELVTHARRIRVAVKSLPGLTDDATRAQFERELKAHITAQHVASGVCRLLGTCEKGGGGGTLCLVMRLYEGNLRIRITAGLEAGEVRRIGHTLSQTLMQLHAAGVIVKDIKPENVLMDEFGQPVLADFGISDVVTRTICIVPTNMEGTFNYMAPELFQRGGYGPQVDVWALACVVVEMCTGVMPWADLQMQQIICAVCVERDAPVVPDHAPAADVLRRCFAFEPANRPTAAELSAALAPEAAELPEVVCGMVVAFASKVQLLTLELASAVAALADAEADRDRAIAERDRVVADAAKKGKSGPCGHSTALEGGMFDDDDDKDDNAESPTKFGFCPSPSAPPAKPAEEKVDVAKGKGLDALFEDEDDMFGEVAKGKVLDALFEDEDDIFGEMSTALKQKKEKVKKDLIKTQDGNVCHIQFFFVPHCHTRARAHPLSQRLRLISRACDCISLLPAHQLHSSFNHLAVVAGIWAGISRRRHFCLDAFFL
jgi:hypothetical protein